MVITVLETKTKPIKTSTLIPEYQTAHLLTRTKFTEMLEKKKMHLADHESLRTGRKREQKYESFAFSCINLELTSIKQAALNRDLLTTIYVIND